MSDPYLLLTFMPLYRDAAGGLYADRLWQRDLVRHFDYIPHGRLACPLRRMEDAEGVDLARVDVPATTHLEIAELPWTPSVASAILALPRTVRALHQGIRDAGLVHSGIVGWPYPLGWIANLMAMAQHKPLVLIVESTPWRIAGTGEERPVHVLRALTTEALGRFFVNRADLTFFTHEGYRRELSTRPRGSSSCVSVRTCSTGRPFSCVVAEVVALFVRLRSRWIWCWRRVVVDGFWPSASRRSSRSSSMSPVVAL